MAPSGATRRRSVRYLTGYVQSAVGGKVEFRVILEPQPEGGYFVYVPALSGCMSQGETKEEALSNIREAIKFYLVVLEEHDGGKRTLKT